MELSPEGGMTEVMEYIKSKEFVIRSMHRDGQNTFKSEDVAVTMELDLGTKKDHNSILVELEHIKGLDYIEEIR